MTVEVAENGSKASQAAEVQARRGEILAELQRILQDQQFRHSKHYTSLLRYVVEQTLDGRTGHLKERVLGSEVFGRDPGYDTNQDPVVRTSACEIRKRLAVFYRDDPPESELRIDLPAGSYVPEFRFTVAGAQPVAAQAAPPDLITEPARLVRRWLRWAWALVPLTAIVLIGGWFFRGSSNRGLDRFWTPLWNSPQPMMLCVSEAGPAGVPEAPASQVDAVAILSERVTFADAITTAKLVGLLRERGKTYEIRQAAHLTLANLRRGPVTLIGGLSNPWSMRLQEGLRFYIERDDAKGVYRVRDRENPAENRWQIDVSKPASELREDYAVISRIADPLTENTVLILAGLGKAGAAAAGEFVTEPAHLRDLENHEQSGWGRKNLQAVISTTVVNGEAASPHIVATSFK